MPRPKKDNHSMTIRLATPIFDRLTEFCDHSGQSKTIAIERALTMYMNDYYEKQQLIADAENKVNTATK